MPSVILSDNGVSSGSAGLKSTAGNDGVLILQTTTSGGTATNAVYIDTTQQVGLGTATPTTKLHVASDGDTAITIQSITGSGQSPSIRLQRGTYGTDGYNDVRIYNTSGSMYVDNIDSTSTATNCFIASPNGIALQGASVASSGVGIKFPATQSASSDANTLDDYEEGTWTPSQGAGLVVVGTFSSGGTYTKIGRMVYLSGYLQATTSVSVGAGSAACGNLPFATITLPQQTGTAINDATNAGAIFLAYQSTVFAGQAMSATNRMHFNIMYQIA
jgi:hypothetical protein